MQCKELNTIFFYLKNKRYAISKILSFKAPLSKEQGEYEMEIMYGLYFNSYNAIIEYITKDLDNKQIKQEIISRVFNNNENNYNYTRELRNSIIHRGLDVSNTGILLKNLNIIVPAVIQTVINKKGNKSYQAFTDNLLQNIIICEKSNDIIKEFCKKMGYLDFKPTQNKEYLIELQSQNFVPKWVQEELQNFDFARFEDIEKEIFEKRKKEYFDTTDLFNSLEVRL